jgi:hypothetical protein
MTTIAIALPTDLNDEQKRMAHSIADRFGYGLSFDLAGAEADVREGIEQAAKKLKWRGFIFLHARLPCEVTIAEYDAALASSIQEELFQYEFSGSEPKFFSFLEELDSELARDLGTYWVIFSGEWYLDERVRFEDGKLQDLISRLKQPANWQQRLLVVAVGRTQDSDDVPLVFYVHSK